MTASMTDNQTTSNTEIIPSNEMNKLSLKDSTDIDDVERLRLKIKQEINQPDFWDSFKEENDDEYVEECKRRTDSLMNDDFHLLRVLIARKRDIKVSYNLFMEQVQWRAKWQPEKTDPVMIPTALKSEAWRLYGYSKEGCIISNYKLSLWKPNDYGPNPTSPKSGYMSGYFSSSKEDSTARDKAVDEYVRYIAYMIELMIGKMPPLPVPQQFVVLFDLEGFTTDMVLNKRARFMIARLIYVAQSQYPERLRKVYLINAPWGFSTAWKLIKALLDPKTSSKVSFVSGDLVKAMSEHIDVDTLSSTYGGNHEEYRAPTLSLKEEIKLEIK